jgi:hypothetical protein
MATGTNVLTGFVVVVLSAGAVAQDAASVLGEVRKTVGATVPEALRVTVAGSGYRPAKDDPARNEHFRIEPHVETLDPRAQPSAFWTSPHGFLAGAAAAKPTLSRETHAGTAYQVVTFTTPAGTQVRGYVNEQNILERTRTELPGAGGNTIRFEAVYLSWIDFGGLKYPSLIIHKENDQVVRMLVVSKIEPAAGQTSSLVRFPVKGTTPN